MHSPLALIPQVSGVVNDMDNVNLITQINSVFQSIDDNFVKIDCATSDFKESETICGINLPYLIKISASY